MKEVQSFQKSVATHPRRQHHILSNNAEAPQTGQCRKLVRLILVAGWEVHGNTHTLFKSARIVSQLCKNPTHNVFISTCGSVGINTAPGCSSRAQSNVGCDPGNYRLRVILGVSVHAEHGQRTIHFHCVTFPCATVTHVAMQRSSFWIFSTNNAGSSSDLRICYELVSC
jgi:hypothetical protein